MFFLGTRSFMLVLLLFGKASFFLIIVRCFELQLPTSFDNSTNAEKKQSKCQRPNYFSYVNKTPEASTRALRSPSLSLSLSLSLSFSIELTQTIFTFYLHFRFPQTHTTSVSCLSLSLLPFPSSLMLRDLLLLNRQLLQLFASNSKSIFDENSLQMLCLSSVVTVPSSYYLSFFVSFVHIREEED